MHRKLFRGPKSFYCIGYYALKLAMGHSRYHIEVMIKGLFMFTDKSAQSSFNFTRLILKAFFRSFEAISTFQPILFRVQQNKSFFSFSPDE